jgi:two-component system sensor histidine kinase CpxA
MTSLFWRLFIWFWLGILLLISVLFVTTLVEPERERRWSRNAPLDALLNMYGQTALEVAATGGARELGEFLERVGSSASAKAFLFAEDGEEVTGRAIPREIQEIADRTLRQTGRRDTPFPFVSHRLVDGDGREYVLILQYDEIPVKPREFVSSLSVLLGMYGETALEVAAAGGPDKLGKFLDQVGPGTGVKAFLFSEDGEEVSRRPFPSEALEIANRALQKTGRRYVPFPFVSHHFTNRDGQDYVLVLQYDEIPISPPRQLRKSWFVVKTLLGSSTVLKVLTVLVLTGIFCFGLASYLTRPILRLRAVTRELSEGNLTARVGPVISSRRDELGNLATEIDSMAERIESLMEAERQLLRDVAHELRSPLTRLKVALELARKEASPNAVKALGRIELETERLNGMISQLLDIARLDGGAEQLERDRLDLNQLLQSILDDASFEADAKDVKVEASIAEGCFTYGSLNLVRTAIENVVRNALQHAPKSSSLRVSLRCAPDQARIEVRDEGPGVPGGDLERIFSPFYRVEESRERKSGGIGLGLAIAHRVVLIYGGRVFAENHPEGGLCVTIQLPAEKTPTSD